MSELGKAVLFNGVGKPLEQEIFEIPKNLGPQEALVEISLATVCGSDVHTWQGHRQFPTPCILGHEMVGKIVAIGDQLKKDLNDNDLSVGDKIVWSMTVGCGSCYYCTIARLPQKCNNLFKYGHVKSDIYPHFTGGFAKYVHLKKGSAIFKIPSDLSDEEVAPLMCAGSTITSGLDVAGFGQCDYVVIQGCGALGLYGSAFAKELGAGTIIAIDVMKQRLDLVKEFGADHLINASEKNSNQVIDEVLKITHGRGADFVIEVTGNPEVIQEGIKLLRIGGKYILLGAIYPGNNITLDSSDIITKCLQIFGMHNYAPQHLKQAINLVRKTKKKYPFKKLVGPDFPLSVQGVEDALKSLDSKKSIRPAIIPQ